MFDNFTTFQMIVFAISVGIFIWALIDIFIPHKFYQKFKKRS